MEEITKLHLADIGSVFRIRVTDSNGPVDLQSCTTKQIIFKKPDDTVVTKDAEFYTDGSDGYIQYTSIEDDLDTSGVWRIQGYVEFIDQSYHTNVDNFLVLDNLESA